jgi:hypothetical protein
MTFFRSLCKKKATGRNRRPVERFYCDDKVVKPGTKIGTIYYKK